MMSVILLFKTFILLLKFSDYIAQPFYLPSEISDMYGGNNILSITKTQLVRGIMPGGLKYEIYKILRGSGELY